MSDPIIRYRESIINKRLTNRVLKKQKDFESEHSSSEEEKAKIDMTVQEMLEHEDKVSKQLEQLTYEKELIKKEQ